MGSNMSDQKNTEEESVLGEIKENMEEKVDNVKEKVNEGVDEVKKRTSNVIKAAKGEIGKEDEGIGGKTLVVLALGCAAGSIFLAAKVEKCNFIKIFAIAHHLNINLKAGPGLPLAPYAVILGGEIVYLAHVQSLPSSHKLSF